MEIHLGLDGYHMTIQLVNRSNKYRPNLPDLMSLCSTNYVLSLRLLADKELAGEKREFFISDKLAYIIEVKEVTKYTSLINIVQQQIKADSTLSAFTQPKMQVRLYHDARVAEVISSQGVSQVKPRYDYPNDQMHHPDEKRQINQFLKEWLQLCLEFGQVNVSLS